MRNLKLAAVLAALIALLSCQGMVDKPAAEPPEVIPAPTLIGTWTATYQEEAGEDSEEQHVMFVDTITFTANRVIQYRAHYRADGTLDSWWADSGTWEDTEDGFVTRVWLENHDDDDDTPDVETRIKKRYLWPDSSRNKLLMHHWADNEERSDNNYDFDAYTRVQNPLPPTSILGTWTWRRNEGAWTRSSTITINADGTSTRVSVGGEELTTYTITGTWELNIANYTADLSEMTCTRTPMGEPGSPCDDFNPPALRRIGFAPTDVVGTIVLSPVWAEAPNDEYPYGWYGDLYDLQP